MEWKLKDIKSLEGTIDVLVIPLFEEDKKSVGGKLKKILGTLPTILESPDFEANGGDTGRIIYSYEGKSKVKRLFFLGLGKRKEADTFGLRKAFREMGGKFPSLNAKSAGILYPDFPKNSLIGLICEALEDGAYSFEEFKKKDEKKKKKDKVRSVHIFLPKAPTAAERKELQKALAYSQGVSFMKDLVNRPPNVENTEGVAQRVKKVLTPLGVNVKILGKKELEKMGFGLILGVDKGSEMPPILVVMEYKGSNDAPIALVGKGMVYDSGGYSLKPANFARSMKMDMSGGAAVFGAMLALAKAKTKKHIIGLVPLTENAIGPSAYRVDDILKSYSGLSVEVINTDAEGRLTLADALSYAKTFKPKAVADIATLTGGALVVLGDQGGCIMGNNQRVIRTMKKASEETDERVWELPMWKEFNELIDSKIADVKNLPDSRNASTIVGGKFLERFVEKTPWVHVDMAPMMEDKNHFSKGWGVRLLSKFVELA